MLSLPASPQPKGPVGLHFDSEQVYLQGGYSDEISAFRARKNWIEVLEANFLLERDHDYSLKYESNLEGGEFHLRCSFLTACGRYAFWRLLNDQAPEVQHLLETAHVPNLTAHLKDHLNKMSEIYIEESLGPAVAPLTRHGAEQRESLRMRLQRRVRAILSFLVP